MKRQILCIHGGTVQRNYAEYLNFLRNYQLEASAEKRINWRDSLGEELGENFDVLQPQMPCKHNARYAEWKIWLEKHLDFLQEEAILIGHSLGAIFLVKYLAENDFPVRIKSLHLVAAPFEDNRLETVGDFVLPENISVITDKTEVFLYHSQDDLIVPFADLGKYAQKLPKAKKFIFTDRGHFRMEKFPEIIEEIKIKETANEE